MHMRKLVALLFLLLTTLLSSSAQSTTTYVFTASNDLVRPITIKTSNGTYKLYDRVEINSPLSWWSAEDANGVHIMQPGASRSYRFSSNSPSSTRIEYHLNTLDPISVSSSNRRSSSATKTSPFTGSRRERAQARQEALEREAFENSFIGSYKGNYYLSGKYSNLEEYIIWRLPSAPSPKSISSPEQYCGRWYFVDGDDTWFVDIDIVDSEFIFSVKRRENQLELYKQENENNWLFFSETYTNLDDEITRRGIQYYHDACDSDADPGFPTSDRSRYKYNEYFSIWYYRISLMNGQVKVGPVLAHRDYYYMGENVYSETYEGEAYDQKTLTKRR